VVDQAIRENWPSERLCYIFASILVGVGSLAIVAGVAAVFAGKDLGGGQSAIAGAISNSLFYPAIRQAREIRKENLCVRLLEMSLANAKTAEEAARIIQQVFLNAFQPKAVEGQS
jgi:hypothetical protein